jgi:hypothetical protein
MDIQAIISAARAAAPELPDSSVLRAVEYSPYTPTDDSDGDTIDQNEETREQVCIALNQELLPQDHTFTCYLLEQEIALHRAANDTLFDTLKRCAYLLYRRGHVEDSQLLWEAKNVHFDAYAGLDIQLLIGAGFDATIAYLKGQPDSAKEIEYLEACQRAGDFDDMESYERFIAAYFGDE